jgi:hypothetical protein
VSTKIVVVIDHQDFGGWSRELSEEVGRRQAADAATHDYKIVKFLFVNRFRPGLAERAMILIRGFASVGIIALIDEATGYQYERPRRDLEEYLKKFLSENLRRWVRTFPGDYFKHLCRLKGVELRPDMKLPQYFGHLTNDLIWRRIAPGLLRALKERRSERGSPSNKLHSWTSEELGKPELLLHMGTVVGLMKLNTDYDTFHKQLDTVAPIYPDEPGLFDDPKDWEKPSSPTPQ